MGYHYERVKEIKALISSFIRECFENKSGGVKENDEGYRELKKKYEYEYWVNDVVRRARSSQSGKNPIKIATHISKGVHPESRGANLYADGSVDNTGLVSSLSEPLELDVVGNAAYKLNEFKFLFLRLSGGESILELAVNRDPCFSAAISENKAVGDEAVECFAKLIDPILAAGKDIKQIYWLVSDDPTLDQNYHLLAPLYPGSLAHCVYKKISRDRFGDGVKEARQARRERRYSETGYRDYPNLAVQKLGGTKPQNISQLNSERGGRNYLLASLPPRWVSSNIKPPLFVDSVFERFGRRRAVRETLRGLRALLRSDPAANQETRARRDEFLGALIDELVLFASGYSLLEPGWSASSDCLLVEAEALWLDAWRDDGDFAQRRESGEWAQEVRHRFASWLNKQLERELPVGQEEHRFWAQHLKQRFDALQEVLPYV